MRWPFRRKNVPKASLEARLAQNPLPQPLEGSAKRKYLGILDSYSVSWSLEKAARDVWQNFFDENNQTLDGIAAVIERSGRDYVIRVQSPGTYDYRLLLHLGGTTKTDNPFSAGGFGEGVKILALVLLRDYDFSQIRYGAADWIIDFTLDNLPYGEYVKKQKGLFADVQQASSPFPGNFIELKTQKKQHANILQSAKDLFYHAANEDFQNPTLDISTVGGLRFLGGRDGGDKIPRGNFYFAGQRRHVETEEWNTVDFFSLWTYDNKALRKDRDRGLVTRSELDSLILPHILAAASSKELIRVVYELEPIWTEGTQVNWKGKNLGSDVLEKIVDQLWSSFSREKVRLPFAEKYLAEDFSAPNSIGEALAAQGYVICNRSLAKLGMKTVVEKFQELQQHYRAEPSPGDKERMQILYDALAPFPMKSKKEVWLFDRVAEKSIIHGQYNEKFVWLSRERIRGLFPAALATYLHELDHKYGSDSSAEFSYALTDTLRDVIGAAVKQPDLFHHLEERWNCTKRP